MGPPLLQALRWTWSSLQVPQRGSLQGMRVLTDTQVDPEASLHSPGELHPFLCPFPRSPPLSDSSAPRTPGVRAPCWLRGIFLSLSCCLCRPLGKTNGNSTKEDVDAYEALGKLMVNGWLLDKDQGEKHAGEKNQKGFQCNLPGFLPGASMKYIRSMEKY